nr:MAGE-like protein 2 [Helicoverpa armigera]
MAFVVKLLFLSALVYSTNGGYLNGQHQSPDSFLASALNSPSASFAPSPSYGTPQVGSASRPLNIQEAVVDDHGPARAEAILPGSASLGHGGYPSGPSPPLRPTYGPPAPESSGSLSSDLSAPAPSGNGYPDGGLLLDSNLPGPGNDNSGSLIADTTLGAPRVIGTTVTVGRPDVSATRYELQSVVQNVIRRVPVEVTRHVQVAVPQPVPVPVRQEVRVPVPQPYPVQVEVVKEVPYPVYKTEHVHVERPVPVEVVREVPVEVIKKVHVPVDRPYEVIKKIHVPIEKHVEVPYAVWKPYPLHIIKHVTHYKKKNCCW